MRNDWLAASDELLLRECRLEFRKASGNGGQKVNKTSSAVRLSHEPSGLVVTSAESRSQHENRRHALKALRMNILQARTRSVSRTLQWLYVLTM